MVIKVITLINFDHIDCDVIIGMMVMKMLVMIVLVI